LLLPIALAAACAPVNDQPGKIELSASEFDFGTIANDTAVSETFQARNVGQGTLEITGVSTSCGCTAAEVDKQSLEPGETANLVVTYDPQVHDGETGRFMRLVYVRSNDPEASEVSITIWVTVVEP